MVIGATSQNAQKFCSRSARQKKLACFSKFRPTFFFPGAGRGFGPLRGGPVRIFGKNRGPEPPLSMCVPKSFFLTTLVLALFLKILFAVCAASVWLHFQPAVCSVAFCSAVRLFCIALVWILISLSFVSY